MMTDAEWIAQQLGPRGPGWVTVWSTVLQRHVVWCRDATVKVPAPHAAHPRFTYAELTVLAKERPPADMLRRIVETKVVFGTGTTVVEDACESHS